MTTCATCHKTIPPGLRYCGYCGARAPSRVALLLQGYRWDFLGLWLLVAAVVGGAAWLLFSTQLLAHRFSGNLDLAGAIALVGIFAAAGQCMLLRNRRAVWWILALPLGWAFGVFLFSIWPKLGTDQQTLSIPAASLAPLALMGALVALLQYPVARHYAWPARRWVLFTAAAFAVGVALIALRPGPQRGGWFTALALRLPGSPEFAYFDVTAAASIGALAGLAQYWLLRRSISGALLWPVVMGLAAGLAAALLDLGLAVGAAVIQASGGPELATIWQFLTTTPIGGMLAWGVVGVSIAISQWFLLRWSRQVLQPRLGSRLRVPGPAAPAGRWIFVTIAAFVFAWPLAWLMLPVGWLLLGGALAGSAAGVPQWLALSQTVEQAPRLPSINAGAWSVLAAAYLIPIMPAVETLPGIVILVVVLSIAPGLVLARR